jgi:hypothetical protein
LYFFFRLASGFLVSGVGRDWNTVEFFVHAILPPSFGSRSAFRSRAGAIGGTYIPMVIGTTADAFSWSTTITIPGFVRMVIS